MESACILIVEDEAITAMDIKTRLSRMGYRVAGIAATGEQAIQLTEETHPDLILMDIKIKGPIDGIQTAELIHAQSNLPIIYLTAYADDATLQRAKLTGPSGYILKPFQERDLAISIEMALYKSKMENALRESEERYVLVVQGANDGIWDWDLATSQVYYSPRWKEIIGYAADEIGSSLADWLSHIHKEDRERFQAAINHHLDGLTERLECELRMLHKDSSLVWVLARGLAVRGSDGRPRRMAGSISNITDLKHAQEQLIYDSYHDSLTGIPNRALFIDRLKHALQRRKRYRNGRLAVLFLDLDSFKLVNDNLGHPAGDQLLIETARKLQSLTRSSDTVARLGGDEFVILLEAVKGPAYPGMVAERLTEVLRTPVMIAGHEIISTASIGVVLIGDEYQNTSDVLRDADIAMYRAKSLGKDRFEVFHPDLEPRPSERFELEKHLLAALERDGFQIYYQPICKFPSRLIVGVEALLRLIPPDHEPIPPGVLIPLAEEVGLINAVGDWVLREACQKMSDWHKRFPEQVHLNLHVNISVKQLSSSGFVERVKNILESTGLTPSSLCLEINETVFNNNIQQISTILEQLTLLGVSLMIDNFGTGYTSLGYIRRFPIDTIKLDRSFIFPPDNQQNGEIIEAVLSMASQLGLQTVAAGIETEEQLEFLEHMQCHFGQGFLLSKPLETQALEQVFQGTGS